MSVWSLNTWNICRHTRHRDTHRDIRSWFTEPSFYILRIIQYYNGKSSALKRKVLNVRYRRPRNLWMFCYRTSRGFVGVSLPCIPVERGIRWLQWMTLLFLCVICSVHIFYQNILLDFLTNLTRLSLKKWQIGTHLFVRNNKSAHIFCKN